MEWIQAISTVGFPIVSFFVAVFGLKYSFDFSMQRNADAFEKVAELTKVVNHNTEVLADLVKVIEKGVDKNDK